MMSPRPTLLIGWAGADWSFLRPLCEKGLLPALTHLVRNGTAGQLPSPRPFVSPMLWTSLATGKRAWKHGIHGFTEVNANGSARPVSSASRRVPALWNMLSAEGRKTHAIGWPASHPAETINGICVSEKFFQGAASRAVFPERLTGELAELLVTPRTLDPGILRLLVPEITDTLLRNDPRAMRLLQALAELYSAHNVAASILETEPWDFAAIHLRFLGQVLQDFAAFVPPRGALISESAFQRYSGVLEGACRLQDRLLGDLLKIAGPDVRVIIVSDHGFLAGQDGDDAPDGIATHQRAQGIFVAAGPGLQKGELIAGATLLDLAPTFLHSFGLPIGADMDGRVLHDIFIEPTSASSHEAAVIPSWDERVLAGEIESARETNPGPNPGAELERIRHAWNLGMDLFDAGLFPQALPHLEEACWSQPEHEHHLFWLARTQAACGLWDEAWETAALLDDFGDTHPTLHRQKGILALETGRPALALEHFNRAPKGPDDLPTLRALALAQLGKWLEALEILQVEATRYATSETWLAIVKCYLGAKRPQGAVAAARQLVLRNPSRAQSHLLLAQALLAAKEKEAAWDALAASQRLEPDRRAARAFAESNFPERIDQWSSWSNTAENGTAFTVESIRRESALRKAAWEKHRTARHGNGSTKETGPSNHIYRAPEANELDRFHSLLKDRTLSTPGRQLRIWEMPGPPRFAGAAVWAPPAKENSDGPVDIRFRFRGKFCDPILAGEFLRDLFTEIAEAGHVRAKLVLPAREPWGKNLANFGLVWTHVDECWVGDTVRMHRHIEAKAGRWASRIPAGWIAREIAETDLPFISEASGALEFLGEKNLQRVWKNLVPGLSSIVQSPAQPVGVFLVTRIGMTTVIEFMGAAPGFRPQSGLISYLALRRALRRDHPDIADWGMQLLNPAKGTGSQAILRRIGAQLSQAYHHFSGELRR